MCGADYMDSLLKEMTMDNVPVALGGNFDLFNEPFEFDVSPTSTLYYEGCERDSLKYIEKRKDFERHDQEEYCYYWNGITPPNSIYSSNVYDSTRTNASETTSTKPTAKEVTLPPPVSISAVQKADNAVSTAHFSKQKEEEVQTIAPIPPPPPSFIIQFTYFSQSRSTLPMN